jgi:hypothetical protein
MRFNVTYILGILFLAGISSIANAQDSGMMDVEVSDTERDRLDREKIISSPGEMTDSRYVVRLNPGPKDSVVNTTSTTAAPSAGSSPSSAPVVTKESKVRTDKSDKPVAASKPPVAKQTKNDDDSILSFNFLYYIIEKYKLQDIVD